MSKDVLENSELEMGESVDTVKRRLGKLRTGKASPALLDGVMVEYYGAPTPLKQLATVSAPEARQLTVKPFDRGSIGAIEKAIQSGNLGLNPSNDGMMIRIQIPELTEERRRELTKVVHHEGENAKIAIRNIRRDAIHHFKELLKDKDISEDEERKAETEIQQTTDTAVNKVDEIVAEKEKELREI